MFQAFGTCSQVIYPTILNHKTYASPNDGEPDSPCLSLRRQSSYGALIPPIKSCKINKDVDFLPPDFKEFTMNWEAGTHQVITNLYGCQPILTYNLGVFKRGTQGLVCIQVAVEAAYIQVSAPSHLIFSHLAQF